MITKQEKTKLLEKISEKEDRLLIANVIDKANKSSLTDTYTNTNFLDLNDINIIMPILNSNKIQYEIFSANENAEKKIICFLPDNFGERKKEKYNLNKLAEGNISCIKIIPNVKGKLKHRDYMGAIYSLGIKREYIGDIFANETHAYFFVIKKQEEYILNNLFTVSNTQVKLEVLDVGSQEVKNIQVNSEDLDIIIPSLRVDVVLSEIYKLSRSIVKDKIEKGDLYINSKNMFFAAELLKENDIISFKKHGKFKMGQLLKKTKSEKLYVSIKKYN